MSWQAEKAEKAVDAEGMINCVGHGKEAVFRTSRTAANPDRDFYACDQKPSCNFFIWADDPHLIRVLNARAGGVPSASQLQTIGRPPSSSLPNAAHSTPTKNNTKPSSSLPTPPKSTTANKINLRPQTQREPSPDWPSDVDEDEEQDEREKTKKKQVLVEEDEIVEDDAQWDTDGEQVQMLQAGRKEEKFRFRDAKGKGKKRARGDDEEEGSDYEATQKEKRRKAIEENMVRMRAEQNLSSSSKPTTTTILQTPPTSPSKPTPNLADKKTIDFLRSQNAKLREEKTSLADEVKRLEGEYAEMVDEVIGLKAKEGDWEEERETWLRRLEVLEGGRRVGRG